MVFIITLTQVASCTLDASAKIYAGRVDSIHAQAYKMLGGLGRADNQGMPMVSVLSCLAMTANIYYL